MAHAGGPAAAAAASAAAATPPAELALQRARWDILLVRLAHNDGSGVMPKQWWHARRTGVPRTLPQFAAAHVAARRQRRRRLPTSPPGLLARCSCHSKVCADSTSCRLSRSPLSRPASAACALQVIGGAQPSWLAWICSRRGPAGRRSCVLAAGRGGGDVHAAPPQSCRALRQMGPSGSATLCINAIAGGGHVFPGTADGCGRLRWHGEQEQHSCLLQHAATVVAPTCRVCQPHCPCCCRRLCFLLAGRGMRLTFLPLRVTRTAMTPSRLCARRRTLCCSALQVSAA